MICLPQLVKLTCLNFKIEGMEIVFLAAHRPAMELQKKYLLLWRMMVAVITSAELLVTERVNRTGFYPGKKSSKLVFFEHILLFIK